ncbi:hypothetical protein C5167_035555 [Papaver somniferum]|uniref:Uncharacterized protein n=1 Tax=Papaver somniferum TaxID=3469 RepID=A0A4Y7KGB2_PAPSO|nr:hypothetical protein C5167_035555 [Papaver somniferum]
MKGLCTKNDIEPAFKVFAKMIQTAAIPAIYEHQTAAGASSTFQLKLVSQQAHHIAPDFKMDRVSRLGTCC